MGHNQFRPAESLYEHPPGSLEVGPLHSVTLEGEVFSRYSGRNLKHQMGTNGRPSVTIRIFEDDRLVTRGIHVLVCEAYHGARPPGFEVSHLDGDKKNNRPENLAWETPSENIGRAYDQGVLIRGHKHVTAKLTEEQVAEIRGNPGGLSQREMSRVFGVGQSTISRVVQRHTYKEET